MARIKRHPPEKLFVSGKDTIIMPVDFTPYTVTSKFIDAEAVVLPGCNPLFRDSVIAAIVRLPADNSNGNPTYGIKIDWTVTGTREVEWLVTELTN